MERLDVLLVEKGLSPSRARAREIVRSGFVQVWTKGQWQVVSAPGKKLAVSGEKNIHVARNELGRYVSRAGVKLQKAVEQTGVNVTGARVLDIGAATGGFVEVWLTKGACQVVGVDAGSFQLAASLEDDPRVVSLEQTNARWLSHDTRVSRLAPFSCCSIDVSFISLTYILPEVVPFLTQGAKILALVKPQFELNASEISSQGVVKDPKKYEKVKDEVICQATELGLTVQSFFPSALPGQAGNKEFFVEATY